MKKLYFTIAFLLVCFCLYGQQMPLDKIAPHRSAFYQETTGKAIVNNESLTFWLYQCSPNDIEELTVYLHSYVESIGYIVDYDSFSGLEVDPQLPTSVRNLMYWRNRNVSITILHNVLIISIYTQGEGSIADRRYFFMSWDLVKG
ncbi:hypothetical protein FACS189485_16290 [Spirochaetia bacterium]|nr:hypothetical protein FACS189485_16290 [Spirochaetia bacterium]